MHDFASGGVSRSEQEGDIREASRNTELTRSFGGDPKTLAEPEPDQ
jgi:hypothetical protein